MSAITDILTSTIDLKRNTPYLLDAVAPALTMSVDRQPVRGSRLEVIVDGASITDGLVTVNGIGIGDVVEVVLQDRSLATKWALQVENGQIKIAASDDNAQDEPIIRDSGNTENYWKLFVDQGMPSIESTVEVPGLSTIDGDSIVESFIFGDNDEIQGESEFSAINANGITIGGIDGGTIQIRAIDSMGQPINQEKTVQDAMKVRFFSQDGRIRALKQGDEKIADYRMMAEPDADVQDMDLVYGLTKIFGLTLGQVKFAEKIYDFLGDTHHIEAEIAEL